jgi:hypothetical protein
MLLISPIAEVLRKIVSATRRNQHAGCVRSPERNRVAALFLYDLGVLEHGDAAALRHLAFQCDRLAAVISQLIVHRLVLADHQIRFAVLDDADGAAALDALRPASLTMFLADGVVIDVAHHIDHFAGHFFRSGCITAMLMFLRYRQRRNRQRGDERRSNCNLHYYRSVIC